MSLVGDQLGKTVLTVLKAEDPRDAGGERPSGITRELPTMGNAPAVRSSGHVAVPRLYQSSPVERGCNRFKSSQLGSQLRPRVLFKTALATPPP